jgi:glycogen operon protein
MAALRIDHVLGFARQFWVPRGAEGRFGAYVRFPMDGLIAATAVESHHHRCLVVGEDLGTIPNGLRERLAEAHILSYRVLWFERDGLGFRPASRYPKLALACLASHDLPTFHGWRAGRDIDIETELGHIVDAAERKARRDIEIARLNEATMPAGVSDSDAAIAAHGFIASTPCQVMLIQADDLAAETEPLNVPGTDRERPNWRRRLTVAVDDLVNSPEAKAIIDRVKAERPP